MKEILIKTGYNCQAFIELEEPTIKTSESKSTQNNKIVCL